MVSVVGEALCLQRWQREAMPFLQRSAVARQAYDCWQVLGVQMASFDGFFRGGKASQPSARKALAAITPRGGNIADALNKR